MENRRQRLPRESGTVGMIERVNMTQDMLAYILEAGGSVVIRGSAVIIEGGHITIKGGWAEVPDEEE